MPNHIYYVIHFHCNEDRMQEILAEIQHDHFGPGSIDFNKLIPMPDDVYKGPLGVKEMEQYPGEKNWYDWSIENWGSKFNAYDFEILPKVRDGIAFNTAWSAVPKVVQCISERFPEVEMEYAWADEDFGSNTGMLEYKNGEIRSVFIPEDRTKEAFQFAAALQGASIEDFGYRVNEKTGDIEFDEALFMEKMPGHKPKQLDRGR